MGANVPTIKHNAKAIEQPGKISQIILVLERDSSRKYAPHFAFRLLFSFSWWQKYGLLLFGSSRGFGVWNVILFMNPSWVTFEWKAHIHRPGELLTFTQESNFFHHLVERVRKKEVLFSPLCSEEQFKLHPDEGKLSSFSFCGNGQTGSKSFHSFTQLQLDSGTNLNWFRYREICVTTRQRRRQAWSSSTSSSSRMLKLAPPHHRKRSGNRSSD